MQNLNLYLDIEKSKDIKTSSHRLVETVDGNTRTKYKLKGIASTTSLDRDNEKVSPDCLNKMALSIKSKKLPIFGNHEHNWENMIGYANEAEIQGNNLIINFETAYEETHPRVKQFVGSLQAGLPLMLSIGGKVKMARKEGNGKMGIIDEVDLLETSVVGIGANPDAFISLDQVAKAFKGDENMDIETEKSAGQSGELSYGKLGETTPHAQCPSCGKPGELRGTSEGGASVYHCHACGKAYSKDAEAKESATPINNISSPNSPSINDAPKLEMEGKSIKFKGDEMAEEIIKETPIVKAYEEEDEEKAYAKFKSRYERMKAEGTSTTPGGENATPKNSINAKSVKEYENMQKAFVDNAAVEGLGKSAEATEAEAFSFKSFRDELIRRK